MPKVFISYSWTSDEYKKYVVDLATALTSNGVDVVLDSWSLLPGHDKYTFMEQMVSDPEINKVLILCDRGYKEKADGRKGGVGNETMIITPEVYGNTNQEKYIPVVMEKDDTGMPFLPVFLGSRLYVDYTKMNGTTELLRAIYELPEYQKPPIGEAPAFVRVKDKSKVYKCAVCGKPITSEGLLVKLKKPYGTVIHSVAVHKGECDDKLEALGRREGINTNSCMELSFFDTDEDREAYMNDEFSMSDSGFYTRYYNANGTLKRDF